MRDVRSYLCSVDVMCCGVCFFKQKTAYEMRISDWSSDVCSSDLSLNANFLRRPKPGDLLADGRLIKCGRRLAYGEVTLVSADAPEDPVCHVTCTYSIPPEEAR